ncbi:MAG: DUF2336 domain-containing protein [Xanthobacteraceae bacterium]|nr:DUF2336 domain-containing protein [Xanthobacteraceae bacterium]
MSDTWSLLAELEAAVVSGAPQRRTDILRRVTTLFLDESDRLNDEQIGVFDDVLVHLMKRIEAKALVQLSNSLCNIDNAPLATVRQLAFDDRIAIAGPVLQHSPRLTDTDLIDIARTKSDDHLLAISGRTQIAETVSDILIDRGSARVALRLASNAGARLSNDNFVYLAARAEKNPDLAEALGFRLDLPIQLLKQLLLRATELVRKRLLANAPAERRNQIEHALADIAADVSRDVTKAYDFSSADDLVKRLNRDGKLNEQILLGFVCERRYEEAVSALALFCSAPPKTISRLMKNKSFDGVLVACKAAKLSWPTVSTILRFRFAHYSISENELEEARRAFLALSQASAQRTMRFMLVQEFGRQAG